MMIMFYESNRLSGNRSVQGDIGMGQDCSEGEGEMKTQQSETSLTSEFNAVDISSDPDFLILQIIRDGAKQ